MRGAAGGPDARGGATPDGPAIPAIPIRKAARILSGGGVVACPTEGVYGLSCLPGAPEAIRRVLEIKERRVSEGLILIAASVAQLEPWAALPEGAELPSGAERPVTWLVPARADVPYWIRGAHERVAVRVTAHPVAAALCIAAGSALVSTSANVSGRPPARTEHVLRRQFGRLVDYVVPGRPGPAKGPSEIRDFETGSIVRAAAT
ncbi:MAG TPA: L-threonylcarbamoyladenylate synthase [Woeseiaceae bacterium]|nr:L-threonylcarbamoyladenylate synthase [Woeseiaceae bacterium]